MLSTAACLERCFSTSETGTVQRAAGIAKSEIESFYVYNYLQILYHHIGDGIKAADAANTYLQKYSGNTEMLENIDFYKNHYPEVERRVRNGELLHHESRPVDLLLQTAVDAYEGLKFEQCAQNFENVLTLYYGEVENCKKKCFLMPKYMPQFSPFWINIGNLELEVSQCKRKCYDEVQPLGKTYTGILSKYDLQWGPRGPEKSFIHFFGMYAKRIILCIFLV